METRTTLKSPRALSNAFYWTEAIAQLEREQYTVAAMGKTTEQVCAPLIKMAVREGGCPLAHVWSVDPRQGRLILIADEASKSIIDFRPSPEEYMEIIDVDRSLTGVVVESKHARFFDDLTEPQGRRRFQDERLLKFVTSMLSIPIQNIGNPNQTLLVVNLFFSDSGEQVSHEVFQSHARRLADAVESNLRERAFRASMTVSRRLGMLDELTEHAAYGILARCIQEAVNADLVTVYVEDWTQTHLSARMQSGTDGELPNEEPAPPDVESVWQSNRETLLQTDDPDNELNGFAGSDGQNAFGSALLVPLHDVAGKCRGVIRCTRERSDSSRGLHHHFTYDDVAIVESMEQAFGPPLDRLLAFEQRDTSLQKLAHELRVPVVAFQAVLERMNREANDKEFRFRYPHFREAGIYVDLMNRLVRELDIVRKGPSEIPIVLQQTNLLTDVIIPAQRFIVPILRRRGISPLQLENSGFRDAPQLRVDAALITQLVFNLLNNAIKYFPSDRPRSDFKCSIVAKRRPWQLEISVADNGPGIPEDDRDRIFQFGVRGEEATQYDVQGGGLGLWISRAVARRHGGELVLKSLADPTEFLLKLPIPAGIPGM